MLLFLHILYQYGGLECIQGCEVSVDTLWMIISDSIYNHFLSLQFHLALDDFGKVVWTIQGNNTVHQFHERSNHWNLKT